MKKVIMYFIFLMTVVNIYGCSKAPAEKEPVIVADKSLAEDKASSIVESEDTTFKDSKDSTMNQPSTDGISSSFTDTDVDYAIDAISSIIDLNLENKADTDSSNNTPDQNSDTSSDEIGNPSSALPSGETKKMTIEIEGMEEEINGIVYNSELDYQITYDKDRFNVSQTDYDVDGFIAENPDPEIYPYVAVYISRYDKASWANVPRDEATKDLDWLNFTVDTGLGYKAAYVDDVHVGHSIAKHYASVSGKEWNSIINNYYFIEHEEYYFIISSQYFLEAEEGYGARINAMLDTFTFE